MKIEGWLTRNPNAYIYDDAEKEKRTSEGEEGTESDDDDDDDLGDLPSPTAEQKQLQAMEQCRQRPQWSQASLPRVFSVLRRLEEQVASYKRSIPHFDELVQQRRDAFRTADAMLHHAGPTPRPTPISEDPLIDAASKGHHATHPLPGRRHWKAWRTVFCLNWEPQAARPAREDVRSLAVRPAAEMRPLENLV
ncbi:hypothetical protein NXS19_002577 [Fusarium pseudograminearum]|nr:hypothetical protein NXS19_002577 [Fusarium pseudograminearum]